MKTELTFYTQLWHIANRYYKHKVPSYIQENGTVELEYKEIEPVYVFKKSVDWKGDVTYEVCPVDYSVKENKDKSWKWSTTVDQFIGKTFFLTKEEAEQKYMEIPEDTRKKYEEIKQLRRLTNN